MSGKIFLSYRHGDSAGSSGQVYDLLIARFVPEDIVFDVDSVPPATQDFVERAKS
jgi:hypothetical protein